MEDFFSVAAFVALLVFPNRDDMENLSLDASFSFMTIELLRLRLLEPTSEGADDDDDVYPGCWYLDRPKDAESRRFPRGVKE